MLNGLKSMRWTLFSRLFLSLLALSLIAFKAIAANESEPNAAAFQSTMKAGEGIYKIYCVACHQANGEGQRLGAPALKKGLYNSSYITIDKPVSLNIDILLNGVEGTPMIGYKQILKDDELAAVITYIRNAWNNNTGDLVTAEEIKARKKTNDEQKLSAVDSDKTKYNNTELMSKGQVVYRAYCARCHQLDGIGKAPYGPRLIGSYLGSDPRLIPYKIDMLLQGVAGTRMRSYAKQLSDLELAAVATYIANGLQNHGNQLIQPQDIAKKRQLLALLATKKDTETQKTYSYQQLMQEGEIQYMAHCARCHLPDGSKGARPGIPALKGSAIITKGTSTQHIDVVLLGVPGSIMRSFGNRLTNLEIAAILTYQRNAFGNHRNDLIQPKEVQERRVLLQKQIDYQNANQLIQQDEKEKKEALNKKAEH